MKLLPVWMFWMGAMSVFAENVRLPQPGPTALEKFVKHRHTQIVTADEIARFGGGHEWIEVFALVARNHQTHPSEMRGVRFVLNSKDAMDEVYLPVGRALALRTRLRNLQEMLSRVHTRGDHKVMTGTEGCAPSQARYRIHDLCVGTYRNREKSGLSFSTGPKVSLFIADIALGDMLDSIDSALVALEDP